MLCLKFSFYLSSLPEKTELLPLDLQLTFSLVRVKQMKRKGVLSPALAFPPGGQAKVTQVLSFGHFHGVFGGVLITASFIPAEVYAISLDLGGYCSE